ncbi:hypothetical protein DYU11_14745 [Fibrisoma montanum]|uniref:Outer membrane protein beta-barrel domain-containing protein n=1 Tax=Fibrisoma montanum TaxID=2305895 RepID=A0A418M826_9BACT|nr:hypothetical protein [Fibrisoma montanum]RIV22278.1 hypothetical protein DYU11_14745 [Fibrisoma montanum]
MKLSNVVRRSAELFFVFMLNGAAWAQVERNTDSTAYERGPYTVVVSVGGGLSYYAMALGIPVELEGGRRNRVGVPATVRVMWHPDHRLRLGLESGYVPMYGYRGQVNGLPSKVTVSSVPVLLVWSMPLAWLSGTERSLARRLSLAAGTGAYFITSRLDYAGTVNGRTTSLGWMAAGSYTQPINRTLRAAVELKWYNSVATDDATFAVQLQLVWRALSW